MITGLKRTLASTAAAAIVAMSVVAPAEGATIVVDNANPQNIPGLTGFFTTGAMMDGMSVTAYFDDGSSETESWGTTGLVSGGVNGTGWSLSLTGDSFLSSWSFVNDDAGTLVRLVLDGSSGLTVFDKGNRTLARTAPPRVSTSHRRSLKMGWSSPPTAIRSALAEPGPWATCSKYWTSTSCPPAEQRELHLRSGHRQ